jgi:hypothetical protein
MGLDMIFQTTVVCQFFVRAGLLEEEERKRLQ